MTQIEILSNRTRSKSRPPLWVRPVTHALIARVGLKTNAPKPKTGQPKRPTPAPRATRLGAVNDSKPQPRTPPLPSKGQPVASKASHPTPPTPADSRGKGSRGTGTPIKPSNSVLPSQPSQPQVGRNPNDPAVGQGNSNHNQPPRSTWAMQNNARYRSDRSGMPPSRRSLFGDHDPAGSRPRDGATPPNGATAARGPQGSGAAGGSNNPVSFHSNASVGGVDGSTYRRPAPPNGVSKDPNKRIPTPTPTPTPRRELPPNRLTDTSRNTDRNTELPVQIPLTPPEPARPQNAEHGPKLEDQETARNERRDEPSRTPVASVSTPSPRPEVVQPAPAPIQASRSLSLERLLELHPGLPRETAVLGVGEDGLPVLLDLNDPTPGSLLLIGDEREKHLDMLRSVVASTAKRNPPRALQFLVITDDTLAWHGWIEAQGYDRHCLAIVDRKSEEAQFWVMRLADWTEQRRMEGRGDPPILVLIDTLDFLPNVPYDVRLNFDWMIKEAPPARIWPIASISTQLALSLGSRMLRAFQGRLLGNACDAAVYTRLGGVEGQPSVNFVPPGEFAVKVGDDWLRFQAPARRR